MAQLNFKTLSFTQKGNEIEVSLLKIFSTKVPILELNRIGPFKLIDKNTIEFVDTYDYKAEMKFGSLLSKYFDELKNKLTGNKAVYVHRNSGIPLIGNVSFGIVYRNSSLIEIKPVTSCNLNCNYCSISEGTESKKTDFVVEKDYLLEELDKLIEFVAEPVEIHIGVQGEPFLYADMEELIRDLQERKMVRVVSIDTNGTLLTKEILDRLSSCDKLQINFSLDAVDEELAKKMAGVKNYNVKHVMELISYASDKFKLIVAPVMVPGYNEQEMEKIIEFIKSLKGKPILGIQKYLPYKTGRSVAKAISWEEFFSFIEELERKHAIKLRLNKEDFSIKPVKELPKPFDNDDEISGMIVAPDRFPDSCLVAAKSRVISVPGCRYRKDKKIRVKIIRSKHNVFTGKMV